MSTVPGVRDRYKNIVFLEPGPSPSVPEAAKLLETQNFTIADFGPKGDCRDWTPETWGFSTGSVNIVDHHADDERFYGPVSSAPLAVNLVKAKGPQNLVAINHVDCDSVLSSGILTGLLPPDPDLAHHAVVADHYGNEDHVADLLQSLEPLKDVPFSFASLDELLNSRPLSDLAQKQVDRRRSQRDVARRAAQTHRQDLGRLAVFHLNAKVESELLAAEVDGAWVVAIAFPRNADPTRTEVKLRLTPSAPKGLTLFAIDAKDIVPNFGGRWNAGSSGRGGGMSEPADPILQRLSQRIDDWAAAHPRP